MRTQSVESDGKLCFEQPAPNPPERLVVSESDPHHLTVHGHSWGIVAMDEAARLRNSGTGYKYYREVLLRAVCAMPMSATPLHNGPMVSFFFNLQLQCTNVFY